MKWIKNVLLFSLENPEVDEKIELDWDEIPKIQKGRHQYIQVSVVDNDMYDRYLKNDILFIRLVDECDDESEALVYLSADDEVVFRHLHFDDDQVILSSLNPFTEDAAAYPKSDVRILGIPTSILRL